MRARDAFSIALDNLAEHKLRSALTMLGITFGVGAVIAMLSIGAGAERQALQMVDRLGVRNVLIRAVEADREEEQREQRKKSLGLSERDVVAIEEAIGGIELISPRLKIEPYKVLSAEGKTRARVHGVAHHHARLTHLAVADGRFLDARDQRDHAQVAVIGAGVQRDLFGAEPAVGRDIKVDDVWLEVVGVLATDSGAAASATFEGVSIGSSAAEIYIPYTTALRKFERQPLESPLAEIAVRLEPGAASHQVAGALRNLLDRLHSGVSDYELVVPEALLQQSRETQRLFNIVMGCIAGISLLVGGIGIMNIMLASVLEQTREIGVRRAVGARRRDIRIQFLTTAFTLSLAGGLLGVASGLAIAQIVAAYADWPTVVTFGSVLLSTGVSMAVGLISGLYPASRAASLDPIEALRYE